MKTDINTESPSIQYLIKKDTAFGQVYRIIGPLSYETHDDGYAFLVHEIIEQMLSVKAGARIFSRFVDMCGGEVTPQIVSSLSIEQIRSTGTSQGKAQYIIGITEAVMKGNLNLSSLELLSDEEVIKTLTSFRGIGNWTAKMYLIFVLNRQDVIPFEDVAFLQGYSWVYGTKKTDKQSVLNKGKKWHPFASVVARYMYRVVDTGLIYKSNKMSTYQEGLSLSTQQSRP